MTLKEILEKINVYERLTRLDKPIGILLLLWPTLWALWMASGGHPGWTELSVFVMGTVLMRSAGCVMNDVADRNFDGKVARTQRRPLATGEISVKEACILTAILSLMAFLLVLFLNKLTILLSLCALFLAVTYPLTKRFLTIPQAYLGVAFGFGIPMAYATVQNQLPSVAWLLWLANIFWAIAYDTEYAMVDRDDDIKIGIKSSALFFGKFDVVAVMLCYMMMLVILIYVGYLAGLRLYYYAGLAVAFGMMVHQYYLIYQRDKKQCFNAFLSNNWIGFVIFFGIIVDFSLHS